MLGILRLCRTLSSGAPSHYHLFVVSSVIITTDTLTTVKKLPDHCCRNSGVQNGSVAMAWTQVPKAVARFIPEKPCRKVVSLREGFVIAFLQF